MQVNISDLLSNIRKANVDLAFWLTSRNDWTTYVTCAEESLERANNPASLLDTAYWRDHLRRCYDGWINADNNVAYYQEQASQFVALLTETLSKAIDADVTLLIERNITE